MSETLVGKVRFNEEATYHDISNVADAAESRGYVVDHIIDPDDGEPHLYICQEVGDG